MDRVTRAKLGSNMATHKWHFFRIEKIKQEFTFHRLGYGEKTLLCLAALVTLHDFGVRGQSNPQEQSQNAQGNQELHEAETRAMAAGS